jgi:hypothetical protein
LAASSSRSDVLSYNYAVIDAAFRDRVVEALWPPPAGGTSVWAILDCARDERVYPALRTSQLDYLCLYSGRLHHEVEAAAPHLIELSPSYRFTPRLIEMGWGQSWGVFLRTKDTSNLRHHLRGFLRVRDESGRILMFRYYDPRVLRVYLPTCRPDELRTVFGPISSYLVEGEDGKSLIEFEFDGNQLHERRTTLTGQQSATAS